MEQFFKKNNIVITDKVKYQSPMEDLISMFLGILLVYSGLFSVGFLLYGNTLYSLILFLIVLFSAFKLNRTLSK